MTHNGRACLRGVDTPDMKAALQVEGAEELMLELGILRSLTDNLNREAHQEDDAWEVCSTQAPLLPLPVMEVHLIIAPGTSYAQPAHTGTLNALLIA